MALPTDTNFADQWFLKNTAVGEYDLNVTKAWDEYTGKGVKVFVFDDGFDYTNPDLAPNYDTEHDHDYGSGDDDAAPFYTTGGRDNHGTAVMGIIGAAKNGTGVVGVAYDSSLTGFRLEYNVTADVGRAQLVGMFAGAVAGGADVVNMSFGGSASYDEYYGAGNVALMKAAIADALADGRDGLGIVLVKAAGNDREDPYNDNNGNPIDVNHNSMDSDSRQIIVAAVDRTGFVSEYSSYGAPVLVAAFGSPLAGEIVTTDRTGSAGYNTASDDPGIDFHFNGTSAATPQISGVVALMLEANADLGWRDVQSILAYSARHVGSTVDGTMVAGFEQNPWNWNAASNWNGGGMHYSQDYGYGLVDALAAVRMAESWQAQSTSANQKAATLDLTNITTVIADANLTGTTFSGVMSKSIAIERVTVDVTLSAGKAADLEVYLTGPDGHEQRLIADQADYYTSFNGTIDLNTQALRGELSNDNWSVRVVDDQAGDALSVSDIVITAYGATPSKNNTYIYTNEFSDYAGDGHSKNLKDTNGGTDLLNASAVTAAMSVNLAAGTGKIDGVAMKIAGIENVFGGDGKDRLTGSTANNDLAGARGADILVGGKGDDDFIYRVLGDSLFGAKHDLIKDFGKGNDLIDLSDIDTMARAGDQGFRFIGGQGFHGKSTELHFELIDKRGTAHDMTLVQADLDGDKSADFQIDLTGLHHLVKGDFIL